MTEQVGVESEPVVTPTMAADDVGDVQPKNKDVVFMMANVADLGERPELPEFVVVEPRDLSATSISFFCDEAPTSASIVLLMGKLSDHPIYVSATVTTCNEGFWERKRRYLVGCELTGRL